MGVHSEFIRKRWCLLISSLIVTVFLWLTNRFCCVFAIFRLVGNINICPEYFINHKFCVVDPAMIIEIYHPYMGVPHKKKKKNICLVRKASIIEDTPWVDNHTTCQPDGCKASVPRVLLTILANPPLKATATGHRGCQWMSGSIIWMQNKKMAVGTSEMLRWWITGLFVSAMCRFLPFKAWTNVTDQETRHWLLGIKQQHWFLAVVTSVFCNLLCSCCFVGSGRMYAGQ